jgi:hypothetical protein
MSVPHQLDSFTGILSESVVQLIATHGKTGQVHVYDNGCAENP